jgi:RNA recognition motif-containing protein
MITIDQEDVDSRSIYIGNIHDSTSIEEIEQHFSSCGTIKQVKFVTDSQKGFFKRYGIFITSYYFRCAHAEFTELEMAQNALSLNETALKNRKIKVEGLENYDSRSVFVGGLDNLITAEDIKSHFASCGTICRVMMMKYSGCKSKRYDTAY